MWDKSCKAAKNHLWLLNKFFILEKSLQWSSIIYHPKFVLSSLWRWSSGISDTQSSKILSWINKGNMTYYTNGMENNINCSWMWLKRLNCERMEIVWYGLCLFFLLSCHFSFSKGTVFTALLNICYYVKLLKHCWEKKPVLLLRNREITTNDGIAGIYKMQRNLQ